MALPDGPSRHLELRHPHGSGPDGRHRRREGRQGHLPGHQAGVRLRVEPGNRRADLAYRRTARSRVDGSRREAVAHTALPHEAGPVRLAGTDRTGPDRLQSRDSAEGAPVRAAGDLFFPLFNPPVVLDSPEATRWPGAGVTCPGGAGSANIYSPPVADPITGVIYIASSSTCSPYSLMPGKDSPFDTAHKQTGATHSEWSRAANPDGVSPLLARPHAATIDGLSIWKGPIARITAIDMNTGEHLWVIPNGDADEKVQNSIRNHPWSKAWPDSRPTQAVADGP